MILTSARMDTPDDILFSAIQQTPFSFCTPLERQELHDAIVIKESRRRDVICEQDSAFPYMGIVLQGVVAMSMRGSVSSQRQTRAMRLYEAFPGDLFGVVALFDEAITLGRATVITKTARYALIPRELIVRLCDQNAEVLREFARRAALRSRELTRRLIAQATEPIIARVASVLLPYADEHSDGMAPAKSYLSELTQAEIAATAGTVKEVAARTIAQLEREGALQRERGHIRYLCRAKLRDFTNA